MEAKVVEADDEMMPELEDVVPSAEPAVASGVRSPVQSVDCQSDDDSDWEEEEDNDEEFDDPIDEQVTCLFCLQTLSCCKFVFVHCLERHQFDIGQLKSDLGLDYFSYIRLINYIRSKSLESFSDVNNAELQLALSDDTFMKPVKTDDALLMFDIDELPDCAPTMSSNSGGDGGDDSQNQLLLARLATSESQMRELAGQLGHAHDIIESLKKLALERLNEGSDRCTNCGTASSAAADRDDSYFNSYAHFSIHHEMLQDRVRTIAYQDAIMLNPGTFRDRRVLDVGCGTGILSMFAARCGATTVVGVDQSEIVYQAIDIIRENGLEGVVSLVRGRVEDVDLPFDKADVIVSEWMGYFLLFESMLDSVIYARDKYLQPGGSLLPNRCTLLIAGLSDLDVHKKFVSFWDDVYGFKMSCMKEEVIREASVTTISPICLITGSVIVQDFDLLTCTTADLQFSSEFTLLPLRSGPLTAMVGWFDSYFDLEEHKVCLSTSPETDSTHWRQTVFHFKDPIALTEGVTVRGKVICRRWTDDLRSLKLTFILCDRRHSFYLR